MVIHGPLRVFRRRLSVCGSCQPPCDWTLKNTVLFFAIHTEDAQLGSGTGFATRKGQRWVVKSRGPASGVLSSGVAQDALSSRSSEPRRPCAGLSSRDAGQSQRPGFYWGPGPTSTPLPDTHHPRTRRRTVAPSAGPAVCTHGLGQGAAGHSWGSGVGGPSLWASQVLAPRRQPRAHLGSSPLETLSQASVLTH